MKPEKEPDRQPILLDPQEFARILGSVFGHAFEVKEGPLLLNADDVARMLRISKRHLYRLKSEGRLPSAIKLSDNCWRWSKEVICRWICDGCLKCNKGK